MITCAGGSPNTNPTTNDIAAPTELKGIHFVIRPDDDVQVRKKIGMLRIEFIEDF
jgi:hypothetical protein